MRTQFSKAAACCALSVVALARVASAQALYRVLGRVRCRQYRGANPTYVSILMEVTLNRPAAEVWKRVGKYCDIGESLNCMHDRLG